MSQSAPSLDFVTEPMDPYVAASIASWTPGFQIPPEPYYEPCSITLTDTDGTALLSADAQVKVRGNWTTSYDKKPLRLKFAEKQSLLGLNNGATAKNWILLAEYKDKSLLRNKTALSIAREILGKDGLYAADAAFVEVEINGSYWGMYLLTEMQQIQENRVSVTEAEKNYTGTDIGYFLEYDGYFDNEPDLQSFPITYADNAPLIPYDGAGGSGKEICPLSTGRSDPKQDVGFTVKNDLYSQEQHDFIANYMENTYRILYEAAYHDAAWVWNADYSAIQPTDALSPQEACEAAVNIQSLADMYIISELTCDADLYWSSFFMDVDFGADGDGRLVFEAPWDYDSAMGNKDRCADGTGYYAANILHDVNDTYETVNPWLCVLAYEEWFQEIVRKTWANACDSGVFTRADAMLRSDTEQLADAFDRNHRRWDTLHHNAASGEMNRSAAHCLTHQQAAEQLTEWLDARVAFLNSELS